VASEYQDLKRIVAEPEKFARLSPAVRSAINQLDDMVIADTSRLTRALFSNWRALGAVEFRRRICDLHFEAATRGSGAVVRLMKLYPDIARFLSLHLQVMATVGTGRNAAGALFESPDRLAHELLEAAKRVAAAINAQQVWDKRFSKAADAYVFNDRADFPAPRMNTNDESVRLSYARGIKSFEPVAGTAEAAPFGAWLTRLVEVANGRKKVALSAVDAPRKPRAPAGGSAEPKQPRSRPKAPSAPAAAPARYTTFGMGEETLGFAPGAAKQYNEKLELFKQFKQAKATLEELESAQEDDDPVMAQFSAQLLEQQRSIVAKLTARMQATK
jgi:hypothetical protein